MSGILRSKQGCWTCRLRKKKCDETRPQCSSCESLQITCYGYGAKPQWMDNGEREQAMIEDFKRRIRTTSRQKHRKSPPEARRPDRHHQQQQQQQQQPVLIAMRPEPADFALGNCDKNDHGDGRRTSYSPSTGMISHSSATNDAAVAPFQHSSASSPVTIASSESGRPVKKKKKKNCPLLLNQMSLLWRLLTHWCFLFFSFRTPRLPPPRHCRPLPPRRLPLLRPLIHEIRCSSCTSSIR